MRTNRVWTSERLRKEFADASKPLFERTTRAQVEEVSVKKQSMVKRVVAWVALASVISISTVVAVDAAVPSYDGSIEATICWDCANGDGVYKTPKAAIEAVNPGASSKEILNAEKEFKYINHLPEGYDYKVYLQAGEYSIPVIKQCYMEWA